MSVFGSFQFWAPTRILEVIFPRYDPAYTAFYGYIRTLMPCPGLLSSNKDIKIINSKKFQALEKKTHNIPKFVRYPLTHKKIPWQSQESQEYNPDNPDNPVTLPGSCGSTFESFTFPSFFTVSPYKLFLFYTASLL